MSNQPESAHGLLDYAICEGTAKLIGHGEECKGSYYEVYGVGDKYIAGVFSSPQGWLEAAEFITEEQIGDYVDYQVP